MLNLNLFDRLPWWNCIRWGPSASSCEPLQLTKNRTIGAMVNPPPSFEEALAEILFHSWDERERMTSEWYHVVLKRFSSMFPFFCNMIQPITWIRKGKKIDPTPRNTYFKSFLDFNICRRTLEKRHWESNKSSNDESLKQIFSDLVEFSQSRRTPEAYEI